MAPCRQLDAPTVTLDHQLAEEADVEHEQSVMGYQRRGAENDRRVRGVTRQSRCRRAASDISLLDQIEGGDDVRVRPASRGAISIGTAALALCVAPPTWGDSTPAANFTLGFSSQRPHTVTGVALHIYFKDPSDPNAKPSPQRKVVIELPAGARIDGAAVPACAASDPQLIAEGPAACAPGSQVGDGTLTLFTGGGPLFDPFIDDVKLFNGGRELIEVFNKQGNNITTATGRRSYSDAHTLTETPAPQPGGPPNGESAVRSIDYQLNAARGPSGRAFITTPSSCPTSGRWSSRLTFTTADGHTYTAQASTPCRFAPAQLQATITPRRVTAARRTRFRIQLRSADPRCTRGAVVRLGGATPVRSDGHGTVAILARFVSAGTRRLTATHPGCRPARLFIRVLDRAHRSRGSTRAPRFAG